MSEMGVLRFTHIVRRAGAAARGGGVSETQAGLGGLRALSLAQVHPAIAAALVGTMAFAEAEPYLAVALGQQNIMPLDPVTQAFTSQQATADRQRQWVLKKIYGEEVGNQIYQREWSTRADEMDLRTKVP